jgi:hypothetical protein
MLDLGPIEQNLAKQAMRSGEPLPDRIANAPELTEGLQLYINAFFDLDNDRTHSFSLTPIPWSSVDRYGVAFKFDEDQYEDLHYFIRRMDRAHLERLRQKQPKG